MVARAGEGVSAAGGLSRHAVELGGVGVVNARAADCCNWDAAWLRAIPGPAVVVEMGGRDEGTGRGTASDWAR